MATRYETSQIFGILMPYRSTADQEHTSVVLNDWNELLGRNQASQFGCAAAMEDSLTVGSGLNSSSRGRGCRNSLCKTKLTL